MAKSSNQSRLFIIALTDINESDSFKGHLQEEKVEQALKRQPQEKTAVCDCEEKRE